MKRYKASNYKRQQKNFFINFLFKAKVASAKRFSSSQSVGGDNKKLVELV